MTIAGLCGLIIFVLLAVMLIAGVPIAVAFTVFFHLLLFPCFNIATAGAGLVQQEIFRYRTSVSLPFLSLFWQET